MQCECINKNTCLATSKLINSTEKKENILKLPICLIRANIDTLKNH